MSVKFQIEIPKYDNKIGLFPRGLVFFSLSRPGSLNIPEFLSQKLIQSDTTAIISIHISLKNESRIIKFKLIVLDSI